MKRSSSRKSQTKAIKEEEEVIDYGEVSNSKKRNIHLTIARSQPDDKEQEEQVNSINVSYNENGDVIVGPLIDQLKRLGFPIDNSMISYFNQDKNVYVYVGSYPLGPQTIPNSELGEIIKIKVRPKAKSIFGDFLLGNTNASISKGSRRTKERKIGNVIKKVAEWRRLYNGTEVNGEIIKKSLEEAAKQVGISKKSLDDYLLQLRNGRKYGFNFNEHKDDKIGILRAFNRKHKNIDKDNKKSKPGRKPARS